MKPVARDSKTSLVVQAPSNAVTVTSNDDIPIPSAFLQYHADKHVVHHDHSHEYRKGTHRKEPTRVIESDIIDDAESGSTLIPIDCGSSHLVIKPPAGNSSAFGSNPADSSPSDIPMPDFALQKSCLLQSTFKTAIVPNPVSSELKIDRPPSFQDNNEEWDSSIMYSNSLPPPTFTSSFELSTERVEAAFEEMVDRFPRERSGRPLVVLDGANIGWHHGQQEFFSPWGLVLAVQTLHSKYDLDLIAFLPMSYCRFTRPRNFQEHRQQNEQEQEYFDSANIENESEEDDGSVALRQLITSGIIVPVPSGDHDDAYILHYARSHHGFIVSNDFYRDYIESMEVRSVQRSLRLWLTENRCGYTFVGNELLLNPCCTFSLTLLHYQHNIQIWKKEHKQFNDSVTDRMDTEEGMSSSLNTADWLQVANNEVAAERITAESSEETLRRELEVLLQSFTSSARQSFALHRPMELRYALFSRINLLIQVSRHFFLL